MGIRKPHRLTRGTAPPHPPNFSQPNIRVLKISTSTSTLPKSTDKKPHKMGRRNVLAAADETITPPDSLSPGQFIVRVVKPEGNNLFACAAPNGKTALCELAERFRNTIWIKRGGFVLIQLYENDGTKTRAEGEIVNVIRAEKDWRKQAYWYVDKKRHTAMQRH